MVYIIIPFLVCLLTHLVKFLIRLYRGCGFSKQSFAWSFFWAGGPPSVHLATLSSIAYLFYLKLGVGPLFALTIILAAFVIYGFVEDRKRQLLFEGYLKKSQDPAIRAIARDGKLLDFSGHSIVDVLLGAAFGLVFTILMTQVMRL